MPTVNAFDAGPQTIQFSGGAGRANFTLGKGQSTQFTDTYNASLSTTYEVAVSSTGIVSLSYASGATSSTTGANPTLSVVPNADGTGTYNGCTYSNMLFGYESSAGVSFSNFSGPGSVNGNGTYSVDPVVVAGAGTFSVSTHPNGVQTSAYPKLIQFSPLTTAPAPTPVAPNESMQVSYNDGGATPSVLVPTITAGGSPVTPDSLTIATPPAHGTAQVVGDTITYLPHVGFSGSDAFAYYATLGGINSNNATVNVAVEPHVLFWRDFVGCQES